MALHMLSTTEARDDFFALVKRAHDLMDQYILTKNGRPMTVMMSYKEFEGWLETLEMATDPEWVKALDQAKKELKRGKFVPYEKVSGKRQKGVRRK